MSYQVIKQPNGSLCIWSSMVDDFIVSDATPQYVIDYFTRIAANEARERAQRIVNLVVSDNANQAYYQFTKTFEEAVARAREVHGAAYEEI